MSRTSSISGRSQIDLLHECVGLDLVGQAVGDDLAVVQDRDALREREGHVHVVLDHQEGDGRIELLQERRHRVRLGGREPGGRLVEQEELRLAGQRQGDLELALLAVREIAHDLGLLVGQPDRVEDAPRALVKCRVAVHAAVQVELGRRQGLNRKETVLERGEPREEVGDLIRAGQAEARAPVRCGARDVPAEEHDVAAARPRLAADQAEERGLARAVGTDDRAALARADREAHAVDRAEAAELLRESGEAQRGGGVSGHQQYLQGGKLRSYTGCFRNSSGLYFQNWDTAGYVWTTVFQSSPSFFSTLRM